MRKFSINSSAFQFFFGGGTLLCDLSHDAFGVIYPPPPPPRRTDKLRLRAVKELRIPEEHYIGGY